MTAMFCAQMFPDQVLSGRLRKPQKASRRLGNAIESVTGPILCLTSAAAVVSAPASLTLFSDAMALASLAGLQLVQHLTAH